MNTPTVGASGLLQCMKLESLSPDPNCRDHLIRILSQVGEVESILNPKFKS